MQVVPYEVEGWGVGEIFLGGDRLLYHQLPRMDTSRCLAPGRVRNGLIQRIQAYFAGEHVDFRDVELDLDWTTPFQRAVADALGAVPYGETITYGELAALAGHPNAQRAAGTFCAANRFPLFLPCHRVVAAGGIGAYGSLGVDYKRRLLELEGVSGL